MRRLLALLCAVAAVGAAIPTAFGDQPWTLNDNVRYMSMGDSFAAGKGAIPVTSGFAYLLYKEGVFGPIPNVTFANAAVPGSDSLDVVRYQLEPAINDFKPNVVTVYIGLNDLKKIFGGANPQTVLSQLGANLGETLCGLEYGITPTPLVIVGNLPDLPWISAANPAVRQVIIAANGVIATVAQSCNARVADVFTAFEGRDGLFLHDRNGADPSEAHPTNLGYRVIAQAFKEAANQ